jgi:hypothetical protein
MISNACARSQLLNADKHLTAWQHLQRQVNRDGVRFFDAFSRGRRGEAAVDLAAVGPRSLANPAYQQALISSPVGKLRRALWRHRAFVISAVA